jgi:hypothetical protein
MKLLGIDLVLGNNYYHRFNSKNKWFNEYFDIHISNGIVWYIIPLKGLCKNDNQLLIEMDYHFNKNIIKLNSIDFIQARNYFNKLFERELLFI